MERIIIFLCVGFTMIICSLLAVHIWIDNDVKENIKIAKQQYQGSAEDALISFLMDDNNSTYDRTHIAIWTLGQIRSEKALPILYKLYKNDPNGETCYGKHDSHLCQYEIHKAIELIEKGLLFSYEEFNE